jgi:DNA (cytosine-5)-methyltransferase 1
MNKPPYRVPSMAEIAALPWNGFTAASTFSGCGGSSLGYRMAGFRVLYANEFIPAAQESYRANSAPYTFLDTRDIRQVQPQDILEKIGLVPGELDLFDGSPPCASFSTAGKREAGWGKVKKYSDSEQRTDDLFFEFARLLRGIQPKTFVAENVSGLVKGTAKGYFLEILRELKSCGYNVACKVLDAQWLGVPQSRQRTIFVGVRNDLDLAPAHPSPLSYRYSVRDAVPHIINIQAGSYCSEWMPSDAPMATIVQSDGLRSHRSGCEDKHGKRKFTIDELKRICAFPDDFILKGTYPQQWERCGRSVPPVMMSHIAATIRDEILRKL